MLFRAGFVRFCFNLQLRPYGGQVGNKPATESKKDSQAQVDKDRTRGTESKSHGHEQCSIRYDCQGGNKPATESKKRQSGTDRQEKDNRGRKKQRGKSRKQKNKYRIGICFYFMGKRSRKVLFAKLP